MMKRSLNVCVLAHVDAGKTTLSEAMLYLTGQIRSAGRVDHGNTHLDTDQIERERGITVFSKQARLELPDVDVTLLDTPGHVDFSAETERTLAVADCAVLVVSGTDGVQGHTGTLWRLLEHYGIPVFIFVNKMDLPGAEKTKLMEDLRKHLSDECVDFTAGDESRAEETALTDEVLLAEWNSSGTVSDESIAAAAAERKLYPVWFGSALRMEGVRELLDGLTRFFPEKHYPDAVGLKIYKIGRDAQGTRLTYAKVTGGTLRVKMPLSYRGRRGSEENSEEIKTEKIDQIRLYTGDSFRTVDELPAGSLCALTGLSETMPGMGIGAEPDSGEPILEPVMVRRMILPPDVNPSEFFRRIRPLEEEDPTLHIVWNTAKSEIDLWVMGQVQTEVLTKLIRERFEVTVSFGPGRIVYRETVVKSVEGVGHFEPLRHYAEVHLRLEPGERGSGITCASSVSEDELDLNWQRLILTHIMECDHPGVLTGAPITDVKITLTAGRAHQKHTEGGDFRQATYRAIRQGLKSTVTALLEPLYRFSVTFPQENFGQVSGDLLRRNAVTEPAEFEDSSSGMSVRLEGVIPVSCAEDLQESLHRMTRGTAVLTMTPGGYDFCHNAEEMIEKIGYDSESDPEHPTGSVFCAHGSGFLVSWDRVSEYMHLPLSTEREDVDDMYEENVPGFFQTPGGRSGDDVLTAEEEKDLNEIYAREFGMTRDGQSISDERKKGQGRRRWNGSSAERVVRSDEVRQKLDKHGKPIYPPKDTRKPLLLIDGYNIIFDWPDLRELAKEDLAAARGKLLDEVSNYQGFTGVRTIVVFDAWKTGRNPASVTSWQNLTVVFTKENETADAWIERTCHEEAGKSIITVATSDGLEQLTVMRLGALRLSAGMLREEMKRVSKEAGF